MSLAPHLALGPSPWFAPLVEPVRPTVEAALASLGPDAHRTPRAGLGGAVAVLVARCYGTRRWRLAAKAAAVAVETWNRRAVLGAPDEGERARWLRDDVGRVRRVWRELARRDEALVRRVADRVLPGLGDADAPETVLLLRGAVAAGVLAGDVPDDVHAALDAMAIRLGCAWERGEVADIDAPESLLTDLLRVCRPEPPPPRALPQLAVRGLPLVAPALRATPSGPDPLSVFRSRHEPAIEAALRDLLPVDGAMAGAARWLLQGGGKRVRPLLVLAATEACGGRPEDALVPAALIEWMHQASLVLDDIVDEASVRRHLPALHVAADVPFAVATACWILARIERASRPLGPAVRDRLAVAASQLAEGQRAELRHSRDDALSLTAYYRVLEAKTARLFACAASLGAHVAGAPAHADALFAFGAEAGLAFQIVDDVLDYTGDAAVLGKEPGADLREGKPTLPLLLLRERLSGPDRDRLAAVLAGGADGDWVRERVLAEGVDQDCLARARVHRDRALDALGALPRRDVLAALATRLVERRR